MIYQPPTRVMDYVVRYVLIFWIRQISLKNWVFFFEFGILSFFMNCNNVFMFDLQILVTGHMFMLFLFFICLFSRLFFCIRKGGSFSFFLSHKNIVFLYNAKYVFFLDVNA